MKGLRGPGALPVSDTVKWTPMRTQTTEGCLRQKGSGIVMTQKTLKQQPCRTLIYYAQDFLARLSPSPENGEDLVMPEEPCSLKLPDWLQTNDLRISFLKMYPACYRMTRGGRFTPSSVRFLSWGTMWNGRCLTARISESPSQGSGCILSDILMEDVPEKYYLSRHQMEQLLYKSSLAAREKESTTQPE